MLRYLGPDINYSERSFAVQGDAIRFGLGASRMRDNAIDRLIRERNEHGLYTDIVDFCKRVDNKVVNKRLLESPHSVRNHGWFQGKPKPIIAHV